MNKIIDWLLQPTPDGATYLQVIILMILLFVLLYALYDTIMVNFDDEEEEQCDDDNI